MYLFVTLLSSFFFFFKQKTAYEMRISDWSSDVCSSDLRFATPDHLRRWALIRAGYRDERSIVCASKAEAQRLAAFIKPMDDYAVVLVSEAVVKVCTDRKSVV